MRDDSSAASSGVPSGLSPHGPEPSTASERDASSASISVCIDDHTIADATQIHDAHTFSVGDSVQGREPETAFFVAGEEVEPVRVATFVEDDRLHLLELLARDGRGGNLVNALFLHVARPAVDVRLVDATTGVARPAQDLQELVVIV